MTESSSCTRGNSACIIIGLCLSTVSCSSDRSYEKFKQGDQALAGANFDAAIADFTEAIRLAPNTPMSHVGRGQALRAKGLLDQALADYDEAIRLDPNLACAYEGRSKVYEQAGKHDLAQMDLQKAEEVERSRLR
jgi:tetratricopeptide (TPR) repeat protein